MFVVHSPRGTFLTDEGLPKQRERFATWSIHREKAILVTQAEFDNLRKDYPFLNSCVLDRALTKGIYV